MLYNTNIHEKIEGKNSSIVYVEFCVKICYYGIWGIKPYML